MLNFDKIVNKLLKKGGKVIFKSDIYDLIDPEHQKKYQSKVDKTIYRLKSEGVIRMIRNGLYVVPDKEDMSLNEIELIEKYYYKVIKKIISLHAGSAYFISGKKSLELHLKDLSIPERLIVITRNISKKVKIGNYEIIFKTLSGKGKNLYHRFSQLTKTLNIEGNMLKVSNLELALVESAIIEDEYEGIDIGLLSKVIKKYKSYLTHEYFYTIGEVKYIMAFNRLKELSKPLDQKLYEVCLDVIKKNGGLFIGEGLRGV